MGTVCAAPERYSPQCTCCKQNLARVKELIKKVPLLERHKRTIHHDQVAVKDHYIVLPGNAGVLHHGVHATVYKARHKRSNVLRALKQVRTEDVDFTRWSEEVAVMQCLDHPHICRLYEVFLEEKYLSQVLELCLGRDLLGISSIAKANLTEATVAWLVRQMVGAVGHIHNQGVCHSELRPEIFIFTKTFAKKPALQDLCLKLVDIGLALKFGNRHPGRHSISAPTSFSPRGTKRKSLIGVTAPGRSRSYCQAPEQVVMKDGNGWIVHGDKCDVWALGTMTYFLVVGKWPASLCGWKAEDLPKNISPSSAAFIARCLIAAPAERASADSLREDSWMSMAQEAYEESLLRDEERLRIAADTGKGSILDVPLMNADAIVKGFQQMSQMNEFERAAVTAVAHHLPEDKTAHLRKVFARLDTNGDGHLSAEELQRGLADVFEAGQEEEFHHLLSSIDTDGNGSIDYTEFIAATFALKANLKDEICEAAFRIFDKDGSGEVSLQEVRQLISGTSDKDSKKFMKMADLNGDGQLDLDEFKRLLFQKDAKGNGNGDPITKASAAHSAMHKMRHSVGAGSPSGSPSASPRAASARRAREARNSQASPKGEKADDDKADDTDALPEPEKDVPAAKSAKPGLLRSLSSEMTGGGGFVSKLKRVFTSQKLEVEAEIKPKKKEKKVTKKLGAVARIKRALASQKEDLEGEAAAELKWCPSEEDQLKVVTGSSGNVGDILAGATDGIYSMQRKSETVKELDRQLKKDRKEQRASARLTAEEQQAKEEKENEDRVMEYTRTGQQPLAQPLSTSPRQSKQRSPKRSPEGSPKPSPPSSPKRSPEGSPKTSSRGDRHGDVSASATAAPPPRPSKTETSPRTESGRRMEKRLSLANAACVAATGGKTGKAAPSPRGSRGSPRASPRGSRGSPRTGVSGAQSPRAAARRLTLGK